MTAQGPRRLAFATIIIVLVVGLLLAFPDAISDYARTTLEALRRWAP